MKKRIITLLAILALLVTCAVFAVQADGETTTPASIDLTNFKCPCSDCNGQPYTGTWITYDDIIAGTSVIAPADGAHYYIDQSLTPGQQISVSAGKEVVYVLDNASIHIGGGTATSGRATLINGSGAKMHLIGNNATYTLTTTGTANGSMGQISGGGELHLYGDLTIEKSAATTTKATASGLFRLYQGVLHIHDCDGMGLPTNDDPVLNAPALAGSTTQGTASNRYTDGHNGGIAVLEQASCTFTMDAGTLNGTSTCYRGGVLFNYRGTININGGTINGGVAGNRGGIIHNASGTLNITGGILNANANMTASYRGITMAAGTLYFTGGTINSAGKGVGDGIAITGGSGMYLAGDATVQNASGTKTNNIWRWNDDSNSSKIYVDADWTGTASLNLPGTTLSDHGGAFQASILYFGALDGTTWADGESTVADMCGLYLENAAHEYVRFAGYQRYLVTCRAGLYENGELKEWYVIPGNAIAAYADSDAAEKYIKLWADYTTTVNDEVVMDLNGRDITKTTLGEGTIYAFDSTVEAGEAGASITAAAQPITQIGGKTYVVTDGVVYPVDVKVTNVSLRPGTTEASMYYTATVTAHANAGIDAWGVAVTLNENETVLTNHMFTQETDTEKMGEFNSVLVKGIAQNGNEQNADRGAAPIYAKAYIMVGEDYAMSAAADYSLISLINKIIEKGEHADAIATMGGYSWYTDLNITA